MKPLRRWVGRVWLVVRLVSGVVALVRLAGAARAAPPIASADGPEPTDAEASAVSVVVPARDEAERIGPLLERIVGAPGVGEVLVVDDQSSDGTADLARRLGATVVAGAPLPEGWAGKAWALQQGIERAAGEWVVTLDADTRPDPSLPRRVVARAVADRLDLVTVGGRFECPTAPARWLHAAMLTTLVYRFGPPGTTQRPDRMMANGQCMALHRRAFLEAGGMAPVRGEVVEDVALARQRAHAGWRVGFLDAAELLEVRMFESLGDTWRGWGRSLALPGVEPLPRQVSDAFVVLLAQALPLPRLVARRGDPIDAVLALARLGTLAGTRRAYSAGGPGYWLSPLADLPATVAIVGGIARRSRQEWRGRSYG